MAETQEWVALGTWVDESIGMFYEAGAVYDRAPRCKWTEAARLLKPGERIASCPRCGQRFANTEDGSAEENRDLHVNGDADIPSICAPIGSPCVQREAGAS